MKQKAFKEFLERKFLDWQREQGERRTIAEFAAWIGVSRGTFNNWLYKSRLPEGESVELLASKLGPEIYDILGLQRPDPKLQEVIRNWSEAPETDKEIADFILLRSRGKEVSREKKAKILKNLKAMILEAEKADQDEAEKKKNRKK